MGHWGPLVKTLGYAVLVKRVQNVVAHVVVVVAVTVVVIVVVVFYLPIVFLQIGE